MLTYYGKVILCKGFIKPFSRAAQPHLLKCFLFVARWEEPPHAFMMTHILTCDSTSQLSVFCQMSGKTCLRSSVPCAGVLKKTFPRKGNRASVAEAKLVNSGTWDHNDRILFSCCFSELSCFHINRHCVAFENICLSKKCPSLEVESWSALHSSHCLGIGHHLASSFLTGHLPTRFSLQSIALLFADYMESSC